MKIRVRIIAPLHHLHLLSSLWWGLTGPIFTCFVVIYLNLNQTFTSRKLAEDLEGQYIVGTYCDSKMTSHDSKRWTSHLISYSDAPEEVKAQLRKKRTASTAFIETASGSMEEVEESSSTGVSTSTAKGRIYNWVDRVTNNDELDELFGKTFYHTGIPFRFADSLSLKAFIAKLRPAYNLPTAKQIAGSILNNVHRNFNANLTGVISDAQHIHLVSDGWILM